MQENETILTFLEESNKIERVYDKDSLVQAKLAWDFISTQDKMTLDVILETHAILMKNQPLQPFEIGLFRTVPIYIGGREGIKYEKISDALKSWCDKMNYMPLKGNVSQFSKDLHIEYEKIHPFVDGNGRTGRMFMNWYLIRNNMPIVIIHEGNEQMEYYGWFK